MNNYLSLRRRTAFAVLVLTTFTLMLSSCDNTEEATTSPTVYSIDSKPYGKTYAEWSAEWWKWVFGTPIHDVANPSKVTHPLLDSTGVNASNGQNASSEVYFLGGWLFAANKVTRNVTIPSTKAIFVPILNVESDTTGNWTADSVRNAIDGYATLPVTLTATLDGKDITDLASYKARSAEFSMTLCADNAYQLIGWNFAGGTVISPVISYGYWLMLYPLSKGSHILHFTGTITGSGMVQDITYNITVN